MGLHEFHTHGRVFRGLEAREHLQVHKRDSHGSRLKMHVPASFEHKVQKGVPAQHAKETAPVETAVSVVYVTLSQTFSGPAEYKTLTGDAHAATATEAKTSVDPHQRTTQDYSSSVHTELPSVVKTPSSSSQVQPTTLATFTTPQTAAAVVAATSIASTSYQSSSTPSPTASPSHGMSGGAKAGIAFVVILVLGFIAAAVFFCWRKRKNPDGHQELLDEKHASLTNGAGTRNPETAFRPVSPPTENTSAVDPARSGPATAPRLSLRPVTQFLPNLADSATEKQGSAWERSPPSGKQNPFADAPIMSEKQARVNSPNPFDENHGQRAETPTAAEGAMRHTPQSSRDSNGRPSTPQSARGGPVAGGAPTGPGPRGPNNVHRVQLDFKPSMEDELELRSGQLVRLLHEYDDGWALCIRMDRSQQGVTPRTCLSKLPVKPRPQGPPPNGRPGGPPPGARRPPPPQNPNGGPMYPRPLTPNQSRPQSPAQQRPHTPTQPRSQTPNQPRPQTPNQPRPMTPTQANRDRANSASAGVPVRKPVPGQAM